VNRPPLREIVLVSRDRRDHTWELRKLWALVLHGLVRAAGSRGYAEADFLSWHVHDIVHALQRCGDWARPDTVKKFRQWHAEQKSERDTYLATARGLRRQWWTYYRCRQHPRQFRQERRHLVIAILRVEALAQSVVYFGDAFAGKGSEGRTIAARFLGHYLLQALRGVDERKGRKPRLSLGGVDAPAIDVLSEWLARILKPHGIKPPARDNLVRILRRGEEKRRRTMS
jgi:hypothetical protein